MSVLRGDCVEVMAGMEPDSVDAIVTDPPYGLEFMGKEWDRLAGDWGGSTPVRDFDRGRTKNPYSDKPRYHAGAPMQAFHHRWAAAALRVAKPGAYLLAFGGTRTVHRMTCALEDAGWVVRDMLVWAYAQGFPKSRASLKPAWEPIVLARKPGASRDLNIDAARIGTEPRFNPPAGNDGTSVASVAPVNVSGYEGSVAAGRWPANVILTDPILDGGWEGVVGGGVTDGGGVNHVLRRGATTGKGLGYGSSSPEDVTNVGYDDTGTYSRFFLLPESATMGAWHTTCPCCRARSAESSSSRGDLPVGSAPSPARTEASSVATTPTGSPHTSGIEPTSWLDESASTSAKRRSPASRPTAPSPSDPASPAGQNATSSDTTTTTHDHSTCGSCAAAATLSSTDEPGSAERPEAPRFLLVPKAPTRERVLSDGRRSPHPTQKPEALIRHLVTLVTPPGGLVLDPFLGSGTLGVVCEGLGVRWVGIEREPEYADWAEERVRDGKPEWAA